MTKKGRFLLLRRRELPAYARRAGQRAAPLAHQEDDLAPPQAEAAAASEGGQVGEVAQESLLGVIEDEERRRPGYGLGRRLHRRTVRPLPDRDQRRAGQQRLGEAPP